MLAVVYLIFNEGYGGRVDLAAEALRLGAALAELMPDEPEVHGLQALMLLDDARREARFEGGELVLLADQDRSRWDAAQIARGRAGARSGLRAAGRGAYVIQAAIASLHMDEPRDWPQIAALYGELVALTGSAVVELNRAIAVAEAAGTASGARPRRPARPRRLPVLPLDTRRPAAPARSNGRGADRVRARPRARAHRARAPLPAAARRRSRRVAVPFRPSRSSS